MTQLGIKPQTYQLVSLCNCSKHLCLQPQIHHSNKRIKNPRITGDQSLNLVQKIWKFHRKYCNGYKVHTYVAWTQLVLKLWITARFGFPGKTDRFASFSLLLSNFPSPLLLDCVMLRLDVVEFKSLVTVGKNWSKC